MSKKDTWKTLAINPKQGIIDGRGWTKTEGDTLYKWQMLDASSPENGELYFTIDYEQTTKTEDGIHWTLDKKMSTSGCTILYDKKSGSLRTHNVFPYCTLDYLEEIVEKLKEAKQKGFPILSFTTPLPEDSTEVYPDREYMTKTLPVELWLEYLDTILTIQEETPKLRALLKDEEKARREAERAKKEAEEATKKLKKKLDALTVVDMKYFNKPSSSANTLVTDFLSYGVDIEDFLESAQHSHNAKYTLFYEGDMRKLTKTTPNSEISISTNIGMWDKVSGDAEKKLYNFILIKINEQAIHNGQLTKDIIEFPLEELVDIGMYGSVRTARRGFLKAMDNLVNLKLSGVSKTKKGELKQDTLMLLFNGRTLKNNICTIYLNSYYCWDINFQFFTKLPQYYFGLPSNSAELLDTICNQVRQNTGKLAKQGFRTLSLQAIQSKLKLPQKSRNPSRDILEPVEKAVEEILERGGKEDMDLELCNCDKSKDSIASIMKKGYLKITPKGEFATPFYDLESKKQKQIEKNLKRKQKIEDTARAKNLEKKLAEAD